MNKKASNVDLESSLKAANQRLKAANLGVTLYQRGKSLYVRATLPPKPGSNKTKPHQQDVAIKVRANPAGLKQAEKQAQRIGADLGLNQFDWTPYLSKPLTPIEKHTVGECFCRFEKDYFERHQRTPTTESSWKCNYAGYIKQLPQEKPLTLNLLEQTLRSTQPDSCTRLRMQIAFGALGKVAEIDVTPLNRLRGKYSAKGPNPRNLPTDEEIVAAWQLIDHEQWKWVLGILATYGLRPHEVFYLDTTDLEAGGVKLTVLEGTKTGSRHVYPLHPEWVDEFQLRQVQRPQAKGRCNKEIGNKVSTFFRTSKVPFCPYDLRHCYAVRSVRYNVPIAIAAKRMGHSVMIHTKTYQAWLSEEYDQKSYETSLANPNRPSAPTRCTLSEASNGSTNAENPEHPLVEGEPEKIDDRTVEDDQ